MIFISFLIFFCRDIELLLVSSKIIHCIIKLNME